MPANATYSWRGQGNVRRKNRDIEAYGDLIWSTPMQPSSRGPLRGILRNEMPFNPVAKN